MVDTAIAGGNAAMAFGATKLPLCRSSWQIGQLDGLAGDLSVLLGALLFASLVAIVDARSRFPAG
jgi:hypothetical protein